MPPASRVARRCCGRHRVRGRAELLVPPAEIRSANGVLDATLTAAPGRVQLGDYAFPGLLYNGAYMPPLLRARLGDTLRVNFRNALPDDPSNLHFHGMNVSPQGRATTSSSTCIRRPFDYEVRIPAAGRQGPGLFGITRTLMAWWTNRSWRYVGRLVVDARSSSFRCSGHAGTLPTHQARRGGEEPNPLHQWPGQSGAGDAPWQMQFWRIGNIGAEAFLKFGIEGLPLYILATDRHLLSAAGVFHASSRMEWCASRIRPDCARSRSRRPARRAEEELRALRATADGHRWRGCTGQAFDAELEETPRRRCCRCARTASRQGASPAPD